MKGIYLHADDFGICDEQVRILTELCGEGFLSSVSVFASDPRLREHLTELLTAAPETRIAVHLNFVEGPSILGHDRLPLLTDGRGFFRRGYGSILLMSFGPRAAALSREVQNEALAQILRVRSVLPGGTGIAVDTHQHTFAIPAVRKGILRAVGSDPAIREIRVPDERIGMYKGAMGILRHVPAANFAKLFLIRSLTAGLRGCLGREGYSVPAFAGVLMTDGVSAGDVVSALPALRSFAERTGGPFEMLFHPARIPSAELCPDPENRTFVHFNTSPRRDEDRRIVEAVGAALRAAGD